ncbi:hypothetical protein MLD38_005153 [Melastoma candidum]|uniref:Uncharacterized protein n=1 Tax=Melastoma candidum TaxID=119954 RepID=A0ACB9S9V8_9MYRT|nr:hypothetical protein MLD38_005153 [Melastoma candidum]
MLLLHPRSFIIPASFIFILIRTASFQSPVAAQMIAARVYLPTCPGSFLISSPAISLACSVFPCNRHAFSRAPETAALGSKGIDSITLPFIEQSYSAEEVHQAPMMFHSWLQAMN